MKAEVLAPAGNREALDAALAAGADAVYFALPMFGARAFAKNFSLSETREIIRRAHLQGVKIYITMNTLLEEGQMEQAYDWARQLYEMGVDALIIQDLGFLHLLHERLPGLELHASTQLSVSKSWQIEKLRELGVKRVVLAREASLDEIRECAKTGMELEAFVHGALCISWSGQCQFSRIRYNRSGNKGACAQPCRMEFTLLEDGKPVKTEGDYLLSPKDLSLLHEVDELEKAGVSSLKIEGRMKSPSYVFEAVSKAKKAQSGRKLTARDEKDLKVTFNREYTKGHTYLAKGKDLMNPVTSNHQGISIGKVLKTVRDKVVIRLFDDLHQNDGLRFETGKNAPGMRVNFLYDEKGKLIRQAKGGDTVQVELKARVQPGTIVKKTVDFQMEQNTEHAVKQTKRQSDVFMKLICQKAGEPLELGISDGTREVKVSGAHAQKAVKRATSAEDFEKQLAKTGNTWAHAAKIDVEIPDDIFVPLKEINALRTQAIEALEQEKLKVDVQPELDYDVILPQPKPLENVIQISRKEQNLDYGLCKVSAFPFEGTQKAAGLQEPEGYFTAHLGKGKVLTGMNITNSYAIAAALLMGYEGVLLSDELSDQARKDMVEAFRTRYGFDAPVMMNAYEHPRLMVMNHCPVNTALKDGQRKNCSLCRTRHYALQGKDGLKALMYGTPDCKMELFDEKPLNRLDEISELKEEGVKAFRIGLLNESPREAEQLVSEFKGAYGDQPAK